MAIRKVSDLERMYNGHSEYKSDQLQNSLVEISYQSGGSDSLSFKSMYMTVQDFSDEVITNIKSLPTDITFSNGCQISGDMNVNRGVNPNTHNAKMYFSSIILGSDDVSIGKTSTIAEFSSNSVTIKKPTTVDSTLLISGKTTSNSDIDIKNHKITTTASSFNDNELVSKNYVDGQISSIPQMKVVQSLDECTQSGVIYMIAVKQNTIG